MSRVSRYLPMRLALSAAVALVATATACGPLADDDSDSQPIAGGPIDIDLVVSADLGDGFTRSGTLQCGAKALGTGFLGASGKASEACKLMATSGATRRRLLLGVESDRACTEQYGGPQVATVTGIVDEQEISATIDRTNGCGIADWELLEPLIGPPSA